MPMVEAATTEPMEASINCLDGPTLQLILQHACANATSADLCSLLLASRFIHDSVLAFCKGGASVQHRTSTSASKALQFTAWLAKYGQLVGSMDLHLRNCPSALQVEQSLANALQQAAMTSIGPCDEQAANGLFLRSCRLHNLDSIEGKVAPIVKQLPAHCLTSLDLSIKVLEPEGPVLSSNEFDYVTIPLGNSLAALTNLRTLIFDVCMLIPVSAVRYDINYRLELNSWDLMLQRLSALTNLTKLETSCGASGCYFQHLPTSLKEITHKRSFNRLDLGQHSNLTRLDISSGVLWAGSDGGSDPVAAVLPKSLVELYVENIQNAEGLLPLENLKVLLLSHAYAKDHDSEDTLQQLSALTTLSQVGLEGYRMNPLPDVDGQCWSALPVRSLDLYGTLQVGHVKYLHDLTNLTSLKLHRCKLNVDPGNPLEFQAALRNLVSLRVLFLEYITHVVAINVVDDASHAPANQCPTFNTPTSAIYIKALDGLKDLQELKLAGMHIDRDLGLHLADGVARQLTALHLEVCDLDNVVLSSILLNARNLVRLRVEKDDLVDDDVLPFVAQLPLLEEFVCSGTGITKQGKSLHLSHLD